MTEQESDKKFFSEESAGKATSQESEKKFFSKVSLNMVTNITRVIVMALVGFLMVPYYIDQFGLATYAILPLATSITTYVLVASESLADSFTRFMIIAIQKGDRNEITRTYSSSVIGMVRIILILLPAAVLISILSPYLFNVGDDSHLEVQMMFIQVMIASLLVSFTTSLDSIYMAHNYLYRLYSVRIVHCLIQVVFVVLFFICFGPSLTLLGLSYLLAAVILVVWLLFGIKRIDPEIRVDRSTFDKDLLKEMSNLGIWSVITRLGYILFIQTSQIVVNVCLGSQIQGEFSIIVNIISMIATTCTAFVAVGVPVLYKHYNNGDKNMLISNLDLFTKFIGMILAFPIAYLIIFAPQVLTAWLGTTYENTVAMVMIMVPLCVARCSMDILPSVAILYKNVRTMGLWTIGLGILNVILAVILIQFTDLGVFGACIAWDISIGLLNFVFYPVFISRLMNVNIMIFFKSLIVDYIAFGILIGLGLLFNNYFELPYGWIPILLSFTAMFIVFAVISMRIGLNKEERGIVVTFFPQFLQKYLSKVL